MLKEYLNRTRGHLEHFYSIKNLDNSVEKLKLYCKNDIYILFFENAKFKQNMITGFIIAHYDPYKRLKEDLIMHCSENIIKLMPNEMRELINVTLVIMTKYANQFVNSKLDPSLLNQGFEKIKQLKALQEEYISTLFNTIQNNSEVQYETVDAKKYINNKPNETFKYIMDLMETQDNMNKKLTTMGLAIYKSQKTYKNNLLSSFALHPVIVTHKTKKSTASKYLFSQKMPDQFYNSDLLRYSCYCDNMFDDMTRHTKEQLYHLDLITDNYWPLFKTLPYELRYVSHKSKFYPVVFQEIDSLTINFRLKSTINCEWEACYNLYYKHELMESSALKDDFWIAQSVQNFLFISIKGDKAFVYESPIPNEFNNVFSVFYLYKNSYQNIVCFKEKVDEFMYKNIKIEIDRSPFTIAKFLPIPLLIFEKDNNVNLTFDYNPKKIPISMRTLKINEVLRDHEFEQKCFQLLSNDSAFMENKYYTNCDKDLMIDNKVLVKNYKLLPEFDDWLVNYGMFYMKSGFKIVSRKLKQEFNFEKNRIIIKTEKHNNWFEFKPILLDELTQTEMEIIDFDFDNLQVKDSESRYHTITPEEIELLKKYIKAGHFKDNKFLIPSDNYLLLDGLLEEKEQVHYQEILKKNQKIKEFDKIKACELSKDFKGILRNYQKAGFEWLNFLNEYNFQGCLADDMGLGKTVQTLALLQTLKANNNLKTSLLVVPLSAIPNWGDEINKFTTNLTYFVLNGKNNLKAKDIIKYDIVLCSYATLRQKLTLLKDFEFDYIILDESQNIKNYTTMTAKSVKVLKSKHRLALSGTPIENNMTELWSLFDFLMPGFLGNIDYFKDFFMNPIIKDGNLEKSELLKRLIFPFILRRKKKDVEIDLPEKSESIIHVEMNSDMEKIYHEYAKHYRESIDESIENNGINKSAMRIFEGMLRLRQICLFPQLVDQKHSTITSPKFEFLQELLDDIITEDHKILIFSQFTGVLDIIEHDLIATNKQFLRIDGSTNLKSRDKYIKEFQENKDKQIFLLSLKSGGVALNLTAADYVIIFDPWWNPAVEAQAVDRAHRFGQTKKVIAYRLIVKNSIEDKILTLQESKKELVESLISEDSGIFKKLSKTELLDLFS